ncbi:hypothetical protein GCM10010429_47110 [Micromonospora olivasterospora]
MALELAKEYGGPVECGALNHLGLTPPYPPPHVAGARAGRRRPPSVHFPGAVAPGTPDPRDQADTGKPASVAAGR